MKFEAQSVQEILGSLRLLEVDWRDDVAKKTIKSLEKFPIKTVYGTSDVITLLEGGFDEGLLVARLFLGLSKDSMTGALIEALGPGGTGVTRFKQQPEVFSEALINLGLLTAIEKIVNRPPVWSDVLVERLRSGRGSAITGQQRGRQLEEFVEGIVAQVFGDNFDVRCDFKGRGDLMAKCDVAIPSKEHPRVILETKGYNATGSKMTDIIGDIGKILAAKRHDVTFMLVTDGLTWKQRTSDLGKIVEFQNQGDIFRIYTMNMAGDLLADLQRLRDEQNL